METEHKEVRLTNLNQGHIAALFEDGWKRVMENIADKNTPANKERVITIKVAVKPNDSREFGSTKVSSTVSLASIKPSEGIVLFSYDGKTAKAYVSDPKQEELPLDGVKISGFRTAVGGEQWTDQQSKK